MVTISPQSTKKMTNTIIRTNIFAALINSFGLTASMVDLPEVDVQLADFFSEWTLQEQISMNELKIYLIFLRAERGNSNKPFSTKFYTLRDFNT